jgi:hypothetical protein
LPIKSKEPSLIITKPKKPCSYTYLEFVQGNQMVPLTQRYLLKKIPIKKIFCITILIGLAGSTIPEFINQNQPLVLALDETVPWNMTLRITESYGAGNMIILGEKPDASDGLDQYDLPEPPAPPQFPYIRSWFVTSFALPFNSLLQEYKSTTSDRAIWNLSIVWMPASENQSITTVRLLWDPAQVPTNHTHSFLLYENDVMVANMITNTSFSFSTNGSLHRFQIIYQRETSHGTEEPIELPVLLLAVGGVICVVIIANTFVVSKRRKK